VIDIGEDLVGAYLREVVGCPLVHFNVRTGAGQGEIDVVGLQLHGVQISEVWLCEVSTHTGGLGGYRGDAPGKIRTKIASVKAYTEATYPGVAHHIEVWSPKVTASMNARLSSVLDESPEVSLVANAEYARRVRELASRARVTTAYRDSPSFRLLQILTRLPENPLD
jgi:proline racemase